MSAIWANSRHEGRALLLLLAIADHADDHGRAYPSIPLLRRKARLSKSTAYRLLEELRQSGELVVTATGRCGRATEYQVVPPGGEQLTIVPRKRAHRLHPKVRSPKLGLSHQRDQESHQWESESPGSGTPNRGTGTITESGTPPTPRGGRAAG